MVECFYMAHTWTIENEAELLPVAETVLSSFQKHDRACVLALKGDLGAGKTAFTKVLAKKLGIQEHITSPTFVIMKSYPVTGHPFITTLTHIDAYRIEDEVELKVLGFEELLRDPHRLMCIEWPELVLGLIPEGTQTLSIILGDDKKRIITYGG